ncbi:MAG TPA: phosphatidylglycerol lysyltransferase domain-containing protein [Methanolinea sp.]|nr:phosphatidylglycerol lysyltransferase domain-containing protein [Methanolinea sp.]HQK55719.1 phosphatidylglycerol lysyltransferase domain-containing protein [Methanolinea sp.]
MIKLSQFRPVTFQEQALFRDHYSRFPQVHSDNLFSNMLCWNHYANYACLQVQGTIVLCSTIQGKTRFRPPIGPQDPDILEDVIRLAVEEGDEVPLVLIDTTTREWMEYLYPGLVLHKDRDHFEYVYRAEDLARLPGGEYLTIRRQLNRFRKQCRPQLEEIGTRNLPEVESFLHEWCEWKQCNEHPFLSAEKDAVMYAISHFRELGLCGLLIRVSGKVGAIAVFEELNRETAVVHFEKGLPECEGIYKAINAETAAFLEERYTFINRESDMGVPGLREAKMRYHPHHMVEVSYALRDDLARLV